MLRKIELDERRPSALLADRLAAAIGLAADDRTAFLAAASRAIAVDRLPLPMVPAPLAADHLALDDGLSLPPTPLLGRDQDLLRVVRLARDVRCLTICGPGGSGKSRLAMAAAEALRTEFPDGIWCVSLAPIRAPELLLPTIALALGLRGETPPEQQLRHRLRHRRALLLLDNLEHLLPSAEQLARLLATTPGLRLLVTSRAPLRIGAEHIFAVQPLPVATAAELFRQRYAAARPDATLGDADNAAIEALVGRLDGLPLAIELAAARGRLLSPPQLLARLDDRLGLLTDGPRDLPDRQRTLRDVVRWSYDLIPPAAQRRFALLSVFVGGFDIESAAGIDPDPAIYDQLAALLDNSLICRGADPDRLTMLETIAEFGRELLRDSGDANLASARHAAWFVAFGARAALHLRGEARLEWMGRLEHERHNLRAALDWTIRRGNDPASGLLLASHLRQFWHVRGHHREGRAWLGSGLALVDPAASPAYAHAMLVDGYLAWFQRDYQSAHRSLTDAVALLRDHNDLSAQIEALSLLAMSALRAYDDAPRATALADEAVQLALRHGAAWDLGTARFWQGVIAADTGDPTAELFARASLAAFAEAGDVWNTGAHSTLGDLALAGGDDSTAQGHYQAALEGFRAIGDIWGCALSLRSLAQIALHSDALTSAELLGRESLSLWRALDDRPAQASLVRLLAQIAAAGAQSASGR